MSQDILQKEMCVQLRIFHLKESRGAKLGSKESQSNRTGNIASDLCFLRFAEQKLELERRTACLSGRFFLLCVVGFFALAADPGFSRR